MFFSCLSYSLNVMSHSHFGGISKQTSSLIQRGNDWNLLVKGHCDIIMFPGHYSDFSFGQIGSELVTLILKLS